MWSLMLFLENNRVQCDCSVKIQNEKQYQLKKLII